MSAKISALTARINSATPERREPADAASENQAASASNEGKTPAPGAHLWTYEGSIPFADASSAAASDVPMVHRFRLGNGLRLLLLVDRSAPVLSYFTWFRVGSRHEKPGKTGLAHLFEHLMFNETEGLKAGE